MERRGSRAFRDQVVGKRIVGVIARPGRDGQPPQVLMMHFDDGSTVEFVSPRSDQLLRRLVNNQQPGCAQNLVATTQLELMPAPAARPN